MTTPHATGRLTQHDDGIYVLLDRIFASPIEDVWASITRKDQLAEWIGTWKGSPETGAIEFTMLFEQERSGETENTTSGTDQQWQEVAILECTPPHRMVLDVNPGAESIRLYIDVAEAAGHTVVTLGQRLGSPKAEASIGVGWDYYLDRLVAARSKEALPVWEDYYPRLLPHYEALADELA